MDGIDIDPSVLDETKQKPQENVNEYTANVFKGNNVEPDRTENKDELFLTENKTNTQTYVNEMFNQEVTYKVQTDVNIGMKIGYLLVIIITIQIIYLIYKISWNLRSRNDQD